MRAPIMSGAAVRPDCAGAQTTLNSPTHLSASAHRSLKPVTLPPADIAVLDQNIDLDDEELSVRGSDLAIQLRQEGFKGIICILTGAHRDEVELLGKEPAVDFAFEKNGELQKIADTLLTACAARTATASTC